jgi:adenylylsulfate kinase
MMAWAVWITGLPGSGKSTIVHALKEELEKRGVHSVIVGIDQVRSEYGLDGYDLESRRKAYMKLVEIGAGLVKKGDNVIFDATGNSRAFREMARQKIPVFAEVFLKCPLRVCMEREFERDERRAYLIYKQKTFVPGLHVDYEEPQAPDITIETDKTGPEESAQAILKKLSAMLK